MKALDYVAIVIAVAVTALVATNAYGNPTPNPIVQFSAAGKTFYYPLTIDREVTPLEDPESCRILIESESVRVLSSNCPQNICVRMGSISYSGQWIACLPHGVFIDFAAGPEGDVDGQTY